MWGGSYAGYDQWATAKELPPHLATIVPAAAAHPGVDFPMRNNIFVSIPDMQWLTFTSGRASQDRIFGDSDFWAVEVPPRGSRRARAFQQLDRLVGNPSPLFQEWIEHPDRTRTGTATTRRPSSTRKIAAADPHDHRQLRRRSARRAGVLSRASEPQRPTRSRRHYLIIGPWDHAGTRTPQAEFGGLKFGQASLVDLPKLHLDWYALDDAGRREAGVPAEGGRVLRHGRGEVALCGHARCRDCAPAALLSRVERQADDVFASGALRRARRAKARRISTCTTRAMSVVLKSKSETSTRHRSSISALVHAARGKQLVYHTAPFGDGHRDQRLLQALRLARDRSARHGLSASTCTKSAPTAAASC